MTTLNRCLPGSAMTRRSATGQRVLIAVVQVLDRPRHAGARIARVARHQRLEGVMVAAPDESDQLLVRLEPEQGRAPVNTGDAGVFQCRDFHA